MPDADPAASEQVDVQASDADLRAGIEQALARGGRLLRLPPALEALYEERSWRGRSRGLRRWLIVVAGLDLLCIGLDVAVMPHHLAETIAARGCILTAVYLSCAALLLKKRPVWVQGLALIVPTIALILVAGYLAQLAGGVHAERYLTAAMFVSFAATVVPNVAFRWVVAQTALSVLTLGTLLFIQSGMQVSRIFTDYVELITFYPVAILVALDVRRWIERMHRRNFLMSLRDELRVRELTAASARREATLANMTQGIVLLEPDGRVPVINHRAVELLGLPERFLTEPLRGTDIIRFQLESGEFSSADFPPDILAQVMKGDFGHLPLKYERTRANGIVLEIDSTPLPNGGVVRTYTDITERKRHEQALAEARDTAEAASRARSEFLAIMSHEIRTPMNAVLGLADSLLETRLDEEQRKSVEAIQESSDGLLGILNDILDLSKLDAGKMEFEAIPFALASIIEDTRSIVARRATSKHLTLSVEIDPQFPPALVGDPTRIRQILLNLISNAIKFTHAGNVAISARSIGRSETGAAMRIAVCDTGIGIPADRVAHLFENFVQADAAIHRRYGGTGLGLAICKRLIDQMGGRIAVDSEPGRGSTFWFEISLPLADVAALEQEARPTAENEDFMALLAALGRPLRILLAEDNPTNQLVVAKLLGTLDIALRTVGNGAEAVAAAVQEPFDAIFMDMRMPEMDGLEATRAIRARGGALARVPIIALTANAFADDMRACRDAGMTDFVAKPIRKTLLVKALARVLAALQPGAAHLGELPHTAPSPATPAPASPADAALIDQSVIGELLGELGAQGLAQLLGVFREETGKRIARLRRLSCDENRDAIEMEAHTLKSAAALVGFARLSSVAAALERDARAIAPADYALTIEQIVAAYVEGWHEMAATPAAA